MMSSEAQVTLARWTVQSLSKLTFTAFARKIRGSYIRLWRELIAFPIYDCVESIEITLYIRSVSMS